MKKFFLIVFALPLLTSCVSEPPAIKDDLMVLEAPYERERVKSPLEVRGKARGTWFFEASFPVRLEDAKGKTLVSHYAQAQGEWMTEDFVPFSSTLIFETPTTKTGTLILEKDNPSGLPKHSDSRRVPVLFYR